MKVHATGEFLKWFPRQTFLDSLDTGREKVLIVTVREFVAGGEDTHLERIEETKTLGILQDEDRKNNSTYLFRIFKILNIINMTKWSVRR